MPCACQKNRKQYEVVTTTNGTERVVFASSNEATSRTVAKRYPGSTVREKPAKK